MGKAHTIPPYAKMEGQRHEFRTQDDLYDLYHDKQNGYYVLKSWKHEDKKRALADKPKRWLEQGWKIHLSVEGADVPKAFEIVAQHCLDMGMGQCKAQDAAHKEATVERDESWTEEQARSQERKKITLYYRGESLEKWNAFVRAVETDLKAAGIRAGDKIDKEQKIPGSEFAYFINGGSGHGYAQANERKGVAPGGPFLSIDLRLREPDAVVLRAAEDAPHLLLNKDHMAKQWQVAVGADDRLYLFAEVADVPKLLVRDSLNELNDVMPKDKKFVYSGRGQEHPVKYGRGPVIALDCGPAFELESAGIMRAAAAELEKELKMDVSKTSRNLPKAAAPFVGR